MKNFVTLRIRCAGTVLLCLILGDPHLRAQSAAWTKEPDSFRGALFLSSERDVKSKFEIANCRDGAHEERMCLFQFELGTSHMLGMLTFWRDSFVDVAVIFPPAQLTDIANILTERYGQPSSNTEQESSWLGKLVTIKIDQVMPLDRKAITDAVALTRYQSDLDSAMREYQLRLDAALHIFELNFDRRAADESGRKAEAELERDKTAASDRLNAFKTFPYSSFSITVNSYSAELSQRKQSDTKQGAGVL